MKTFLHRTAIYTSLTAIILFVGFTSSVFPSVTGSTADSAQVIKITSLQQALDIALANNSSIQAKKSIWESVKQEIKVAGAWPEPTLSFTQFVESVETRNGPQNQQIAVNQMLPIWGTTGLKSTITSAKARKAYQDYENVRQRVTTQVKSVWANLFLIDSSTATLHEYKDLVRSFGTIAETRYATGKGLQTAILKSQLELSSLDEKLLNFEQMRATASSRLNALLNQAVDATIAPVRTLQLPELQVSQAALIDSLNRYRQDLLGLQALVNAKEKNIVLQKRMNLPMIGVGVNYIRIGDTQMPAADPGKDALAVMAKIDLPLWFGKNKAKVEKARNEYSGIRYQYADKKNAAIAEVKSLYAQITQSAKTLELYRNQILPQAEQTLNSALAAYRTGDLSFLDLLDAERMIVQFKLKFYREQANYFTSLANLERAIGTKLN